MPTFKFTRSNLPKGLAWFDKLTTNRCFGRAVVGVHRGKLARLLAEEKPPFALSLSKGLTAWFDRRTTSGPEHGSTGSPRAALLLVRQTHHERVNYSGRVVVGAWRGRLARWFAEENLPFALSLSKGLTAFTTGSPSAALCSSSRNCQSATHESRNFKLS